MVDPHRNMQAPMGVSPMSLREHLPFETELEEVEHGLLVRQGCEAYVARNWRCSSEVIDLIEAAQGAGFPCMIREDHPRKNARWPNPRGVVYLAFSPTASDQWSMAIDTANPQTGGYGVAVFNGKYHEQFQSAGIPFRFEARNKTAGHLIVARNEVIRTLRRISGFDHSVLTMSRVAHSSSGFTTEYVIQRSILLGWSETPWGRDYVIVQDEFPVDGGLTSRRIDILARHRRTGDWLVIELKRAEAGLSAVRQIEEYLLALGRRDDFAHGKLKGVLVAERISLDVYRAAEGSGIECFEIAWPLRLSRV